jgi:hypothetical protein
MADMECSSIPTALFCDETYFFFMAIVLYIRENLFDTKTSRKYLGFKHTDTLTKTYHTPIGKSISGNLRIAIFNVL